MNDPEGFGIEDMMNFFADAGATVLTVDDGGVHRYEGVTMDDIGASQEGLSAALYLMAKKEFHLLEVEAMCKALNRKLAFDIVGPRGSIPCRFVDPHYGIFERTDTGGSMHVKGFQFVSDIHCENIRYPEGG